MTKLETEIRKKYGTIYKFAQASGMSENKVYRQVKKDPETMNVATLKEYADFLEIPVTDLI